MKNKIKHYLLLSLSVIIIFLIYLISGDVLQNTNQCYMGIPLSIVIISAACLVKYIFRKNRGSAIEKMPLPYRCVWYVNPYFLDYYSLFGVNPDASDDEIQDAFLKIMNDIEKTENPDFETRKFISVIKQAYATLSNPEEREFYNQALILHYFLREN
jgi:hypothetical protein